MVLPFRSLILRTPHNVRKLLVGPTASGTPFVFNNNNAAVMQHIPCCHMSMLDYFRKKKKTKDGKPSSKDDDDDDDEADTSGQIFSLEDNVKQLTEEEIDQKRNKSRLRPDHWRRVKGEIQHPEPVFWTHYTVKYKQKMFGTHGEKSGVNPGILWPTRRELKERIDYENICNPFTIQEMVLKKRQLRLAEKEEFERREQEVDEKLKLVDKFKAELLAKQQAKEKESEASRMRKEKLMEEVRRHFGYTVDTKDERFQEMLLKKEKEQKKVEKEARQLEKQKRALEKLDPTATSTESKMKVQNN